jgi:hypothetical protein
VKRRRRLLARHRPKIKQQSALPPDRLTGGRSLAAHLRRYFGMVDVSRLEERASRKPAPSP